jgi:hypothetical protein
VVTISTIPEPQGPLLDTRDLQDVAEPRVGTEQAANAGFVLCTDDQQRVAFVDIVSEWTPEQDPALLSELVHVCGVLMEADLLTPRATGVPLRTLGFGYEEVPHLATVAPGNDMSPVRMRIDRCPVEDPLAARIGRSDY